MKRLQILLLVFLPGCFCGLCGEPREPSVFQEEYLPFKAPNRDSSRPAMVTLRDDGDGFYWEMLPSMARGFRGKEFEWGKRYKVEVTSTYNVFSQFWDRSITALLEQNEAIDGHFRLHSISKPYFGEDRRSFLDGKPFECISEGVCAQLDSAVQGEKRFDIVMGFGESASAPLVLKSVESPTCYNVLDCTIRQECCDQGDAFVCVADDACPAPKIVGVDRKEYKRRR